MIRTTVFGVIAILSLASAASAQESKGEQVYAAQKCSLCHSISGVGNAKGPLDEVGTKLTPEELRLWILDAKGMTEKSKALRKPAMRNYVLPPEDLDALVAYLSALKKK
jgi:mono/diheme cytochrome c family protein